MKRILQVILTYRICGSVLFDFSCDEINRNSGAHLWWIFRYYRGFFAKYIYEEFLKVIVTKR